MGWLWSSEGEKEKGETERTRRMQHTCMLHTCAHTYTGPFQGSALSAMLNSYAAGQTSWLLNHQGTWGHGKLNTLFLLVVTFLLCEGASAAGPQAELESPTTKGEKASPPRPLGQTGGFLLCMPSGATTAVLPSGCLECGCCPRPLEGP